MSYLPIIEGFSRLVFAIAIAAALLPSGARAAEKETSLAEAYNASGQALFDKFAETPGNIVFSPYSIGAAMTMALSGARGETEAEMIRVLAQRLPRAEIDAANAALMAELGQESQTIKLAIANAIVLTSEKAGVLPEYTQALATNYGAELFRTTDVAEINKWVERKTEGKIPAVLDKLEATTSAVLLNAIYFRADWESAFKVEQTKDEDFQLSPTEKVQAPMMRQERDFRYVAGDGYRAIRLPYAGGKVSMIVVLPNQPDGVDAVRAKLGGAGLGELIDNLGKQYPRPADLHLPRFKTSYKAKLVSYFQKLGMKLPFDAKEADFTGMVTDKGAGVYIDDVIHDAVIEVNEKGAEAAASTTVKFSVRSSGPSTQVPPEPFIVDRPFLFYIVDAAAKAVVFEGRIADPRK